MKHLIRKCESVDIVDKSIIYLSIQRYNSLQLHYIPNYITERK